MNPLIESIKPGDKVTIVDRFGKQHTGRAVMRGPAGWVLNMGRPHGTPLVTDGSNIVRVTKGKAKQTGLANSLAGTRPQSRINQRGECEPRCENCGGVIGIGGVEGLCADCADD